MADRPPRGGRLWRDDTARNRGAGSVTLSISAVYTTLERLEQKGCVRILIGEPDGSSEEAAAASTSS